MSEIKNFTHGGNVHKASLELGIKKEKILDFSANINPLGMSPKGIKSIKKSIDNILNYPDPGYNRIIESLSYYYKVNANNLLPGNGAIELIYSYCKVNKKGRALIPGPGFVEYEKALLSYGWEVLLYDSKCDIDPTNVDVIFICNPNNPTGLSYSESFLTNLLDLCKVTKTDLFLDEAFNEFSSYNSMSRYIKEYDNLYILKSLTKFFAIPGLRLGALLTSNINFKNQFKKNIIPWSINSVVEDYIIKAVYDKHYIKKSIIYIKKERVWLYKRLSKINGIKVYRSQGNYMLLKNSSGIDLCGKLKNRGILVRSCSNYNNLDSRYIRVAVKKRKYNRVLLKYIFLIINNVKD